MNKTKINTKGAIKLNLTIDSNNKQKLQTHFSKFLSFQNSVSRKIHQLLKQGIISSIEDYSIVYNGEKVTDSLVRELDWMQCLLKDFSINKDYVDKSALRALYWEVFRRYSAFIQRNKGLCASKQIPSKPISIRQKSINLKERLIKIHGNMDKVSFLPLERKKENLDVKIDKSRSFLSNVKFLEFDKKGTKLVGGIYNIRKSELVLVVNKYLEVKKPKSMIGFDINQTDKNFLVFSDKVNGENFFSKPEKISLMENTLKEINKSIKEKGATNSSKRKNLRGCWKKQHRKLEKEVSKFLFPILDSIDFSEKGLAIDTVATGAKTSSYGQDKVIKLCINYCKKNNIYYYLIPTPYTSQKCSVCGKIDKKQRNKEQYKCSCGYEEHADFNAARNIKEFGGFLLSQSHPLVDSMEKGYKKKTLKVLKDKYRFKRNPITEDKSKKEKLEKSKDTKGNYTFDF
jgi:hypothetical protein